MTESTKHDRIFLQVCDDEDSEWCGEVTWRQDRIHGYDVEYINADLVRQQLASRDVEIAELIDTMLKALAATDPTSTPTDI